MVNATDVEELAHLVWNTTRGPWEAGLFTSGPTDIGLLDNEVTGTVDCPRQPFVWNDPTTFRPAHNANIIEWVNLPAVELTYWGLWLVGDNQLRYHALLTPSITIAEAGNSARAPVGALRLDAD